MPAWVVVVLGLVLALGIGVVLLDAFARSRPQNLATLPRLRLQTPHGTLDVALADRPDTVGPGLAGQRALGHDEGLRLCPPDADTRVTMLGMRFALDVLWLDAASTVVQVRTLPPRPLPLSWSGPPDAATVVECRAGCAAAHGITVGTRLVPTP